MSILIVAIATITFLVGLFSGIFALIATIVHAWKIALKLGLLCAISLAIFFPSVKYINQKDAEFRQSSAYVAQITAKGAALEKYFSRQPMPENERWWKDLGMLHWASDAEEMSEYRDIFQKYLGNCPSDKDQFVGYFRDQVRPALFNENYVVYTPKQPVETTVPTN